MPCLADPVILDLYFSPGAARNAGPARSTPRIAVLIAEAAARGAQPDTRERLVFPRLDTRLNESGRAEISHFVEAACAAAGRPELGDARNTLFFPWATAVLNLRDDLAALIARTSPSRIVVHGPDCPSYMPLQEVIGERHRRILWYPDLLLPGLVADLLHPGQPVVFRPSPGQRARAALVPRVRPPLIAAVKLALALGGALRALADRKLYRAPLPDSRSAGADKVCLIIIRSAQAAHFANRALAAAAGNAPPRRRFICAHIKQLTQPRPLFGLLERWRGHGLDSIVSDPMPAAIGAVRPALRNLFAFRRVARAVADARADLVSRRQAQASPGSGLLGCRLLTAALVESHRTLVERDLYAIELERLLGQLKRAGLAPTSLISFEMGVPYSYVEARLCARHGIGCATVEFGNINPARKLSHATGDYYFLHWAEAVEMWSRIDPQRAERYHQLPRLDRQTSTGCEPVADEVARILARRSILVVLQPSPAVSDAMLAMADGARRLAERLGFTLLVKPHPRQERALITELENAGFTLIGTPPLSEEELSAHSLIVGSVSTVLTEALSIGVPFVSCLFDDFSRRHGGPSVAEKLGSRLCDPSEFDRLIPLEAFVGAFVARRRRLIGEGQLAVGAFDLNHVASVLERD